MNLTFQTDGTIFSYNDILIESEISTIILSVHSQYSDNILNSLTKSLSEKYTIKSSLKNNTTLNVLVFHDNNRIGVIDSHYVCLVARVSNLLYKDIIEILKSDFGYFRQIVCKIDHVYKEERLSNRITVKMSSGIVESIDDMIPVSAFLFYYNEILIAKILIKYYNLEMDEYEPTVIFTDISKFQEKSEIFFRYIEDKLRENGFVKIWINDIQSDKFWIKNNYQIIGKQALKYLV